MGWCTEETRDGTFALTLRVHAQPGAKRTEVVGEHGDALKIRLAAPAVDGKANAELLRYLAEQFGVSRSRVTLVRGDTGREKLVRVSVPARRPDRAWATAARRS